MGKPAGDVGALELNDARVRGEHPADHIERSGLTGSVGPDQTGYGSFLDRDRTAAKGPHAPIGLGDLTSFEQVGYEPLLTSSS
jgi:hypothetical protein